MPGKLEVEVRMAIETTHYEYYQLRAMLEWDLADRAPDATRRERHRHEAEKYQLLAKTAKQGMSNLRLPDQAGK